MTAVAARNSDARESILGSIRENLAASRPFDDAHSKHDPATGVSVSYTVSSSSREELVDNFKRNLESVGGHCQIVSDVGEAAAALRSTIGDLAAVKIAISDAPLVTSVVDEVIEIEFVKNADPDFLFGSDIGITSAQWGIAETGTLVLESAAESHRLTSLVPPVHVCILETGKIRQSLGEILESVDAGKNGTVTFVTGASRTSDIELTLAIGVHGPRELHVILIADH